TACRDRLPPPLDERVDRGRIAQWDDLGRLIAGNRNEGHIGPGRILGTFGWDMRSSRNLAPLVAGKGNERRSRRECRKNFRASYTIASLLFSELLTPLRQGAD